MPKAPLDEQTERAARAFLQRIGNRYDVVAAILFGSRARRMHRPDSNADVAVLLRGTPGAFVSTKLDMADSAYDVLLETGSCYAARSGSTNLDGSCGTTWLMSIMPSSAGITGG